MWTMRRMIGFPRSSTACCQRRYFFTTKTWAPHMESHFADSRSMNSGLTDCHSTHSCLKEPRPTKVSSHIFSPRVLLPHELVPHRFSPCATPRLTDSCLTSSRLTSSRLMGSGLSDSCLFRILTTRWERTMGKLGAVSWFHQCSHRALIAEERGRELSDSMHMLAQTHRARIRLHARCAKACISLPGELTCVFQFSRLHRPLDGDLAPNHPTPESPYPRA